MRFHHKAFYFEPNHKESGKKAQYFISDVKKTRQVIIQVMIWDIITKKGNQPKKGKK